MNNYDKYLKFRDEYNFEKDKDYLDAIKYKCYKKADFDDNYILNIYLEKFYGNIYGDDEDKYYDLEFNIIRNFPKDVLKDIIEINFNTRNICYKYYLHIEIVKFIYFIWNDHQNELYFLIQKIKSHLI